MSQTESKTTKLLKKILEQHDLVDEYNVIHYNYKNDPRYKEDYLKIVAKVQVKLQLTLYDAENKSKQMEIDSFQVNGTISVNPENKDKKQEYINTQNKIKIASCLINHFNRI